MEEHLDSKPHCKRLSSVFYPDVGRVIEMGTCALPKCYKAAKRIDTELVEPTPSMGDPTD